MTGRTTVVRILGPPYAANGRSKRLLLGCDILRKVGESNRPERSDARRQILFCRGVDGLCRGVERAPMKSAWILAAALLLPPGMAAQSVVLPSGTILPIELDTGLNAAKVHPGEEIRATVMQNIPDTAIRRRAKVLGQVLQVSSTKNGPAKLEIRFDAVQVDGRMVPFRADLRAVAGFMTVEAAKMPETFSSEGITPENADTTQIGGDQVNRVRGSVHEGQERVGQPTAYGVLVLPRVDPGKRCRGVVGNSHNPQALWLFSADACGVYGLRDVRIEHAGRTYPRDKIILASSKGKLELSGGTGLLLRIQGSCRCWKGRRGRGSI